VKITEHRYDLNEVVGIQELKAAGYVVREWHAKHFDTHCI
jgi:hypothetical protein